MTNGAASRPTAYDLVVVGGGRGGVAAALTAARLGGRSVLVCETDWLGGQVSSQCIPPDEHPWIETVGQTRGYREFRARVRAFYRDNYPVTATARSQQRAELLGLAAAPVAARCREPLPEPGPARPASGLRVVDFSALWAGPLCAHLLGLAGADVVKVETPQRPDGARRGNPDFYRLLHAGHRCVALDPDDPAGRYAMAALVDAADIVIEASRPRALARFGLDARAAAATGTTWVSITAAGRTSQRVGFGDDVAAAAGLVALDDRGDPVFCGDAIADPLTGLTAAVLSLTSPPGSMLDLSMSAVVAATLAGTSGSARLRAGRARDGSSTPPRAPCPWRRRCPAPPSGPPRRAEPTTARCSARSVSPSRDRPAAARRRGGGYPHRRADHRGHGHRDRQPTRPQTG